MSPVDNGHADAMPDNRIDPYADWTPAKVGCHWTRGPITISTVQNPDQPTANYVVVRAAGNVLGYASDFAGAVNIADFMAKTLPPMKPSGGGAKALDTARHTRMGFLTSGEVKLVAQDDATKLTQLLVRCGRCRFVCAAQDVAFLIESVEKNGDYVRDVSIPATRS